MPTIAIYLTDEQIAKASDIAKKDEVQLTTWCQNKVVEAIEKKR